MANRFQNFYTTTLTTDIGANDDTIRVNKPPTDLVKGTLTLEARNPDKREIIKFTGVNDNLLTGVIRGAEGTRATTHSRNASVEMNVTAEMLNEAYESQSSLQDLVDKHFGDFINEGAVVTVSARSISMTAGKVYIKGLIVDIPAVSSHTFTDNKDVAIDIDINGNLYYTESTIGSLANLQPNRFRIWKAKVATTIQDIVRGRDVPNYAGNIDFTTFGNIYGSATSSGDAGNLSNVVMKTITTEFDAIIKVKVMRPNIAVSGVSSLSCNLSGGTKLSTLSPYLSSSTNNVMYAECVYKVPKNTTVQLRINQDNVVNTTRWECVYEVLRV